MTLSTALFSELKLGEQILKNRILMAPLTRSRAVGSIPNELMAEHYAQRASSGLLIAEATSVMAETAAFMDGPSIHSQAHIDGWKKVTDAVHAKGGKIFLQIWHGGRASHPALNGGKQPVAASALAITNDQIHTPEGKQDYTVPHALELAEIPTIIEGFKQGAINAKAAGFDGVEVHAANGYLLDNFLRDGSNKREDIYGGSMENRSRLLFEVIDAVVDVWGADRVGIRTSPLNSFNSMEDSDPVALTTFLAKKLSPLKLAYWHQMRADFFGIQKADVMTPSREHYDGILIGNMGYSKEEAIAAVENGLVDAVAFGVPFIANPDLVERFKQDAELNAAEPASFYGGGAVGYTDYPTLEESKVEA